MSKKKKDKNDEKGKEDKKKKERKLAKELSPSPKPHFNPHPDGIATFPGASRKIKTTSISDIMPSWYDHRDP